MKSEIVTVGDELLIGQVINTNQAYIAERLNLIGVDVHRMTTVGDDQGVIVEAFRAAWETNEIVIVTGGLGPTHDDITKRAVCTFFDSDLVSDPGVRAQIESLMRKRNMAWTQASEEQTMVPRKATVISNPVGTAAGLLFTEGTKHFIVLPGVPYEMEAMVDESVIPFLRKQVRDSVIRHLTLRTTGVPESVLSQQLGDLGILLQGAKPAFLPSPTGVRLRITIRDTDGNRADSRMREAEDRIRARIQRYIYAVGEEELEETLARLLTEKKRTIAVAESCTGGLIADRITNINGSSVYFERGLVAYSNQSKITMLGVPASLLLAHGAVSKEVAQAMAEGVRTIAETDIGLSTTGIAGPAGGTAEKPIGLVWIGYADAESSFAIKFNFGEGRRRVKLRASQAALELVRRKLLSIP
jgi:nicotinamide-nucleotide amidase